MAMRKLVYNYVLDYALNNKQWATTVYDNSLFVYYN